MSSCRFCHSSGSQRKKTETAKRETNTCVSLLAFFCLQRAEESVKHEGINDTNFSWCPWNDFQRTKRVIRETGDQRKNQDHSDHIENIYRSVENLRRHAVTQNSIKKTLVKIGMKNSQGLKK